MKSLWVEFWSFVLGRKNHPVYRREVTGISYMGLFRGMRRGCLPLVLAIVIVPGLCCGATILLLSSDLELGLQTAPVTGLSMLGGMFVGSQWLLWFAGLLATALTATAISAEIETQSYALLRMTSIPPREVVLAKFSAALHYIRPATLAIVIVRLILPVGVILMIILAIALDSSNNPSIFGPTSLPPPSAPPQVTQAASEIANVLGAVLMILLALFTWLAYYLLQPFLMMMQFAAIGMFGSSLSRTRTNGLFTAVGMRLAVGAVSYVFSQFVSIGFQVFSVPIFSSPTRALWFEENILSDPLLMSILIAAGVMFWLLFIMGSELVITLLMLHWSSRRAERLPYN